MAIVFHLFVTMNIVVFATTGNVKQCSAVILSRAISLTNKTVCGGRGSALSFFAFDQKARAKRELFGRIYSWKNDYLHMHAHMHNLSLDLKLSANGNEVTPRLRMNFRMTQSDSVHEEFLPSSDRDTRTTSRCAPQLARVVLKPASFPFAEDFNTVLPRLFALRLFAILDYSRFLSLNFFIPSLKLDKKIHGKLSCFCEFYAYYSIQNAF